MSKQEAFEELRGQFDGQDPFMTTGHQIITVRRGTHKIPDWTKDKTRIQKLLLRSFPKMMVDSKQREQAGRWARVIHLYFRMQMTSGQVAEEMELPKKKIYDIILRIQRVSHGRRANGTGLLELRKKKRPKENVR